MSTTVSYKGNTIATLNNETKTLTTAGTWVEGNITVTDTKDNPTLQAKTNITPIQSSQTITADSGYDGLSSVQINAIPENYKDSIIFTATYDENTGDLESITCNKSYSVCSVSINDAYDYSAIYVEKTGEEYSIFAMQGREVYDPSSNEDLLKYTLNDSNFIISYYQDGTITVTERNASATTPATTITANPSISVNSSTGVITATASASQSVTPTVNAGYVASGTAGTVTVSGSNTSQLTTQSAQTIHPSTSDQTITSGKYLTGAQTIKGVTVTNLTAANIVDGVTVKIGDSTDDDCVLSITGTYANVVSYVENSYAVQLVYDSQNEVWKPNNYVYSEVSDIAYNIPVLFYIHDQYYCVSQDGKDSNGFHYTVAESIGNNDSGYSDTKISMYTWNSNGISLDYQGVYYDTSVANAGSDSVESGKVFFNSSGYSYGTATARSSSDLTVSGATVTVPAGIYKSNATKTISSGSATPASSISATGATVTTGTNTLTLTKTVSNTPQVSAGYISNGTAGNTDVSLTASINTRSSSDLTVSGATVTAPAGYYASSASKSVASGTEGTPTATKGAVSNHQVSVTPSVTNTAGYISGSTKTGTAVTVTASELASGNKEITQNGTNIDVVGYSTVSVAVPSSSTAIITDTTDAAGGTIRTVTTTDEVYLQTKTITPISTQQTILPDTGYDGFSSVIVGASSGGGSSSSYTRTVIASQQTVTPTTTTSDGSTYYSAQLNLTSGLESGEEYIITYNGTEYFYTCRVLWGTNYLLGEINYFYGTTGLPYPFGILWTSGNTCRMACGDSTAVTIKIEKLEFVGNPSATAHEIYFEFSDGTDTTIDVYYNDSLISTMITAYTPTTYGQKTVTLAQLDGVTWYEPANIPLNTELVDFSKVLTGYAIQNSGAIEATGQSWDAVTDYILIDPSMTFTFKCSDWYNVGFYDSSKNSVRVVSAHDIGTSFNNDVATGTLNSTNIPSNAAYIVLSGNSYSLQGTLSLIRTA